MGRKGARLGWVVAKAKQKKQDDTNGKVYSGYDVYIIICTTKGPLQDLDKHVLAVEVVSGPHCITVALHWCYFTINCEFTLGVRPLC